MMNARKLRFYTERYEKEKKYIKLQENFVLTSQPKLLTGKFYAKHDVISASDVQKEYVDFIEKRTAFVPKDIYGFRPPSVNMEYGWFIDPFVPKVKDSRLRFPRKQAEFVAKELQLRKLHRGIPTEKFTGIPFKI